MSLLVALGPVVGLIVVGEALTGILSGTKSRPIDIDCPAALMAGVESTPVAPQIVRVLQQEAYLDDPALNGTQEARSKNPGLVEADGYRDDPLFNALLQTESRLVAAPKHVLLLSGGGAWGAFGAGFLAGLASRQDEHRLPQFAAITGVSTGAVQALLLATGTPEEMEAEYLSGEPVGRTRTSMLALINGITRHGGLTDLSPLLNRLQALLLTTGSDGKDRLQRLAETSQVVQIGVVEAGNGRFRIFDLGRLAKNIVAAGGGPAARSQGARCIAGTVVASSAVPLQMVPIRLRDPQSGRVRTYIDGGVRVSLFDAHVAEIVRSADKNNVESAGASAAQTTIHVIRNGPTVGRRSKYANGKDGPTEIDVNPHVLRVMELSQSTLVNQNEISSIALLRLTRPDNEILAATADGYSARTAPCTELPGRSEPFPVNGMKCLADWGHEKAKRSQPWITLPKASSGAQPTVGTATAKGEN